jgi:hypothetical protein
MKGRLLPLLGILAVVLVAAGLTMGGETPDTDAPVTEVVEFYTDKDDQIVTGSVLLMLAGAALLAWSVQLRGALIRAEGGAGTRSTFGFAGTVIFAVGIAISAGLGFALGETPEKFDPTTLQTLHVLNMQMFPPLAIGVFLTLIGYGLAIIATRALPVWLGWVAVVAGVFAISPLWFVPFLALGILMVGSSIVLAMRSEAAPPPSQPAA